MQKLRSSIRGLLAPNGFNSQGRAWPEPGASSGLPPWVWGPWIGSEAARTRIRAHMGWWHCRLCTYRLYNSTTTTIASPSRGS